MSGIIGDFGSKSGYIGSKPFAFLTMSAQQTVTSGSEAKVSFNQLNTESGAMKVHGSINSNGWQVPESGIYKVFFQCSTHTTSNNISSIYMKIVRDSTVMHGGYMRAGMSARHESGYIDGILRADANQVLYGYMTTSGSGTVKVWDDSGGFGQFSTCLVIQFLGKN